MDGIDKLRLRDAFNENIANMKNPDEIMRGWLLDGTAMTYRQAFESMRDDPRVYKAIEKSIESGTTTLDKVVENIKTGTLRRVM